MATVIPKKGQIVLTKEAFDAKAAAGQLIPGAEYLISNIQYATTEEVNIILQSAKDYTDTEVDKKVDKTSVSESVVANSVVKRTVDGDILVNDDNTAMASKPSNIAVSKGYVQYIMTTLSELFGQNLEAVISSISSSASTDGYTQTLTFKNVNDIGIGTLDIVMPKTNLEITEDSSLFKYTFTLKDSKGNTLSTKTIDLPLEELVVNGSYNNITKSIVLTLKNGNTVDIPVGDLVEGLVNSTDLQNALSTKVDKVSGKGLSTNDYTNTDKAKLDGLANIKTIGDNLTLDEQGKLSAETASGVSSINGQTGAVTGIATTEEVNTAKQSANSYTDTKTGEISTALQQNTTKVNELEQQNISQSSQIESLGQVDQNLQSQIDGLEQTVSANNQSAQSQIDTLKEQNTTIYVKFDTVTAQNNATIQGSPKFLRYGKFYKFTSNLIITGEWTLGGGYAGWSTPIAIATISGGNEALTTDELTYLNERFGINGTGILAKKAYIENGTIYISVLQAAGGTNTITQVHFMQRDWTIIDYPDPVKYPVGSIYMSTNSTSPAEIYGGTWERIKDRFLLGSGDCYSAGDKGGSATHTLTERELASHPGHLYHNGNPVDISPSTPDSWYGYYLPTGVFNKYGDPHRGWSNYGSEIYPTAYNKGESQPHNNMPPYEVVYIWKRTA